MEILTAAASGQEAKKDEFFGYTMPDIYSNLIDESAWFVGEAKDTKLTKALCLVSYFCLPEKSSIGESDNYRFFKLFLSYGSIMMYLSGILFDPSMYNYLLHTLLVALANQKFFRRTFDYYGKVKTTDKDLFLMRICFMIDSILGVSFVLVGLPYQLCIMVLGALTIYFVVVPLHTLYWFVTLLSQRNDSISASDLANKVPGFLLIILPSLFDVLISKYLIISEAMFIKSMILLMLRIVLCFYDHNAAFIAAVGVSN